MTDLAEKVLDMNRKVHFFSGGDRIVVGVSGGADSVCLLQVLLEMRETMELSLYVVHVHHGLRGAEADRDAALVEEMAGRLGLPFCLARVNVRETAGARGWTEEEAGRFLRYEAFERYRKEVNADKIAVAHHQDDQAETVLFHLFRGTGLRGLAGMPAVRGAVIRPLLAVSRREIEQYAAENGLPFVLDHTNLLCEYSRNKIRLRLLPYVAGEINPQAARHIAQAAGKCARLRDYMEGVGRKAKERLCRWDGGTLVLDAEEFSKEEEVVREEVLRQIFSEFLPGAKDISQVHYEQTMELAAGGAGKQMQYPGNVTAVMEYGRLCFKKGGRDRESLWLPCDPPCTHRLEREGKMLVFSFRVEKRCNLPVEIPQKDYTKWMDYDMIEGSLVLRNPKQGDYFVLNANGDRKKLSRYYIDEKIPGAKRGGQLVLAVGSHVLWAVPGRMSAFCRVSEQTKRVLVVTEEREGYHEGRSQGSF